MRVDSGQFILLSGFKSPEWPLKKSVRDILNKFAWSNGMFVSAVNASIWQDNTYRDEVQYIQVTFFEDENYINTLSTHFIYPMVRKFVDKFDPVQLNYINSNNYAYSIEDYFKMCSQFTSFFTKTSPDLMSGNIMKTIDNADNALIELDMLSAVN